MHTVTISLPDNIYRRLEHAAKISGKSILELATYGIENNLPPLMENIPVQYQDDLKAMERFSDDELWSISRRNLDEKSQKQYRRLLNKNKIKTLSEKECRDLNAFRKKTDHFMLRKGYALLLLKWRGHKLPSINEIEGKL